MDQLEKSGPKMLSQKLRPSRYIRSIEGKFLLQAENFFAIQTRESVILPFLGKPDLLDHFPSVYVDMGAIKFVCNGAK